VNENLTAQVLEVNNLRGIMVIGGGDIRKCTGVKARQDVVQEHSFELHDEPELMKNGKIRMQFTKKS
jgi:hypothetical protein